MRYTDEIMRSIRVAIHKAIKEGREAHNDPKVISLIQELQKRTEEILYAKP